MKKFFAFIVGSAFGLIIFSIGREIYFITYDKSFGMVLSKIMSWVGSLIWFYDYQTFIGALIALTGAFIGSQAIYRQIKQDKELEDQRTLRKQIAIRSVLPLSLSSISRYTNDSIRALVIIHNQFNDQRLHIGEMNIPEAPKLPMDSVLELKEMIEFSTHNSIIPFRKIIELIQVFDARLSRSLDDMRNGARRRYPNNQINIEEYILDALKIRAWTMSLFDYARYESETLPLEITWEQVRSGLVGCSLHGQSFDGIRVTIDRRSKGDLSNPVT